MQNLIIKSWISKKIKFTNGILKWIIIKIRLSTLIKITKIKVK